MLYPCRILERITIWNFTSQCRVQKKRRRLRYQNGSCQGTENNRNLSGVLLDSHVIRLSGMVVRANQESERGHSNTKRDMSETGRQGLGGMDDVNLTVEEVNVIDHQESGGIQKG